MRIMETAPAKQAEAVKAVGDAFAKRREIAERLADQDRYIGYAVRQARAKGHTWAEMARAAQVSDVAILKASRRPTKKQDAA